MEHLVDVEWYADFGPSFLVVVATFGLMWATHRVITARWERSVRRDVADAGSQVIIGMSGMLLVVLLLPVDQQTRENMLTVGGLVLSAIVGFSSTTVIKDAAAGITLRFIEPFRKGDYMSTGPLFGRVSDMGFFHVELQTEQRSLVTLTYTELLAEPFEIIPASGAILDTTVTLRYDVPRDRVEEALLAAAEACDLKEPFVHIEELGRVTVTYKVAGLLEEIDGLLTARSNFRMRVLDSLHEHGVELLAPSFQGKWDYEEGPRAIPKLGESDQGSESDGGDEAEESEEAKKNERGEESRETSASEDEPQSEDDSKSADDEESDSGAGEGPEAMVFDKALKARKIEDFDDLLANIDERIKDEDDKLSDSAKERLERRRKMIEERKKKLEERIEEEEEG